MLINPLSRAESTNCKMGQVGNHQRFIINTANNTSLGHPVEHGKSKIQCAQSLHLLIEDVFVGSRPIYFGDLIWEKEYRLIPATARNIALMVII